MTFFRRVTPSRVLVVGMVGALLMTVSAPLAQAEDTGGRESIQAVEAVDGPPPVKLMILG